MSVQRMTANNKRLNRTLAPWNIRNNTYRWSNMFVGVRACDLTYGPNGCSNGSQDHQRHTHPNQPAGGQHTGQRDSPAPCRHTHRYTHISVYGLSWSETHTWMCTCQCTDTAALKPLILHIIPTNTDGWREELSDEIKRVNIVTVN